MAIKIRSNCYDDRNDRLPKSNDEWNEKKKIFQSIRAIIIFTEQMNEWCQWCFFQRPNLSPFHKLFSLIIIRLVDDDDDDDERIRSNFFLDKMTNDDDISNVTLKMYVCDTFFLAFWWQIMNYLQQKKKEENHFRLHPELSLFVSFIRFCITFHYSHCVYAFQRGKKCFFFWRKSKNVEQNNWTNQTKQNKQTKTNHRYVSRMIFSNVKTFEM